MEDVLITLEEIAEKYADSIDDILKNYEYNIEVGLQIDKAASNLAKGEFTGLAAAFNNEDFGGDIIKPGAFTKQLLEFREKDEMPGMFFNHKSFDVQIGEWLMLKETSAGLLVKGQLWVEDNPLERAVSQEAEMVRNSMFSKGPKGLSIGGSIDRTDPDNVQFKEVGPKAARRIVRILKELRLREISAVSFPMNDRARIKTVKSCDITIRQAEKALVELGYSPRESKTILSKGFNGLQKREASDDERDVLDALTKGQISGKLDLMIDKLGNKE